MNCTGSSGHGTRSWPGCKKKLPTSPSARRALVETESDISITRQTQLLGIARSTVYRAHAPVRTETRALARAIDEIYTAHPYYGQRRLVAALARGYDLHVGRDAVRTAMETLGISALYPAPKTSTAHPNHPIYPYLLRGVMATRPNHIWGTDITYIRLEGGFCYLVVLLDWYSRKVLSWRLSNSLATRFCIEALEDALLIDIPVYHNSDQGVQLPTLTTRRSSKDTASRSAWMAGVGVWTTSSPNVSGVR